MTSATSDDRPMRRLTRRHRGRLLLTYAIFAAETAINLLQPLALGWAVEAFLTGGSRGLVLFALQQAVGGGLGVVRRLWDACFFNRVAAEIAQEMVLAQRAAGAEISIVAARVGLSNKLVDFLERDVPFVFHSLVQGVGAIVMLGVLSPPSLPLAMALLTLTTILSAVYMGFSRRGMIQLHDEMERTVTVVASGRPTDVQRHFGVLAGARQFLVRVETAYFGIWQAIGLGFIASIFAWDSSSSRTAGEWTAVLGYALLFLTTLVNVPQLIDQFNRLRDISRRVAMPTPIGAENEQNCADRQLLEFGNTRVPTLMCDVQLPVEDARTYAN